MAKLDIEQEALSVMANTPTPTSCLASHLFVMVTLDSEFSAMNPGSPVIEVFCNQCTGAAMLLVVNRLQRSLP